MAGLPPGADATRTRSAAALLMSAFLLSAASASSAQDRWRIDVGNGAAVSGFNGGNYDLDDLFAWMARVCR